MDEAVHPTVTEIDGNVMDSRCVDDAEVLGASGRKCTWSAAMPKLDTKA